MARDVARPTLHTHPGPKPAGSVGSHLAQEPPPALGWRWRVAQEWTTRTSPPPPGRVVPPAGRPSTRLAGANPACRKPRRAGCLRSPLRGARSASRAYPPQPGDAHGGLARCGRPRPPGWAGAGGAGEASTSLRCTPRDDERPRLDGLGKQAADGLQLARERQLTREVECPPAPRAGPCRRSPGAPSR